MLMIVCKLFEVLDNVYRCANRRGWKYVAQVVGEDIQKVFADQRTIGTKMTDTWCQRDVQAATRHIPKIVS